MYMPKSNIDIKNIAYKAKLFFFSFGRKIIHYSEVVLIFIFVLMALFWVFLFWKYAYYVSSTDPQAPPAVFIKVRRTQLDQVVADIDKREQERSSISKIQVKNIFEDRTITSTSTSALSPGFLPE